MIVQDIITNEHISTAIIDIINESKEFCCLVSPYYNPGEWNHFTKALEKASSENKKIAFLFKYVDPKSRDYDERDFFTIKKLNELYNFDIFFIKNLHAKIYLNENTCLITSMNLLDHSQKNNYEIGYIIKNSQLCKEISDKIIINEMINHWCKDRLYGKYGNTVFNTDIAISSLKESPSQKNKTNENHGYCIRCGKAIVRNSKIIVMCNDCYDSWRNYGNYDYLEKYCVKCGKESSSITYRRPLCNNCFYSNN